MANTYERRVPPGGGLVIGIILGIIMWLAFIGAARAQETAPQQQTFYVFVDTAGVSPVEGAPGVYLTWVFAKASEKAYPSSGILVAWDCGSTPRLVRRLAQVVYRLRADSAGVDGDVQEVNRPWQQVTDPRMADMVCRVGAEHDGTATHPWFAPGKPRSDA